MSNNTDNRRFTIIIDEINYWKTHKLLPKEYCDYLLALYTNGVDEKETKNTMTMIQKFKLGFQVLLCFLILPFSFLVIYFTKFEAVLQLTVLILFITYSLWCYIDFRKQKNRNFQFQLALVVTLLVFLLFNIHLGQTITQNNLVVLFIILFNFLFWFYLGWTEKINFLKFASVFGIVFTIFYLIL